MESNFDFGQIVNTTKKNVSEKILCYNAKNFSALSPEIIAELKPKIIGYEKGQQKNLMIVLIGIEKEALVLIASMNKKFTTERITIKRQLTNDEISILKELDELEDKQIAEIQNNLSKQISTDIQSKYEKLIQTIRDKINQKYDNEIVIIKDSITKKYNKKIKLIRSEITKKHESDKIKKEELEAEINDEIKNKFEDVEKRIEEDVEEDIKNKYGNIERRKEEDISDNIKSKYGDVEKLILEETKKECELQMQNNNAIKQLKEENKQNLLIKISELYPNDPYKSSRKYINEFIFEDILLCNINYDRYFQDCKPKLKELYNEMIDENSGIIYSIGETNGVYKGDRILFVYDLFVKLNNNIKLAQLCKIKNLNISESYIILDSTATNELMESIGGTEDSKIETNADEHNFNKIVKSTPKESENSFIDLTNIYNRLLRMNYVTNFNVGKWVVSNSIEYSYLHPLSTICLFTSYLPVKDYNIRLGNIALKKLVAESVECLNIPQFSK